MNRLIIHIHMDFYTWQVDTTGSFFPCGFGHLAQLLMSLKTSRRLYLSVYMVVLDGGTDLGVLSSLLGSASFAH